MEIDLETDLERDMSRRLHVLGPAPEPSLAEGRTRFLMEAARMKTPAASARRLRNLFVRPTLAFAGLALAAFIFGGAFFTQIAAAPTVQPTLTATPTRVTTKYGSQIPTYPVVASLHVASIPLPAPVPEPSRAQMPGGSLISLVSEQRLTLCWKL